MLTIMQLPQSDPSVQRIVKSLWLGHKKITLDTVLTSQLVSDQIVQYQRASYDIPITDPVELEMKMLRRRTVNDLRVLLTYLIKKENPEPKTHHWYSCFVR